MSNLVIVAIPDENDRVWKVSSEKVPHLTLLFLGDSDKVSNVDQIVQFVEHAADTMLNRVYMSVDRRAELGDDKADVLHFRRNRWSGYRDLLNFRMQLLKDDNIRTAYDSGEQWDGPWKPHLTLGYPNNPAKDKGKDSSDHDYGFYDVSFTKIAVWVDEYDGPEFELKDFFDDYDMLETAPLESDLAMSAMAAIGSDGRDEFRRAVAALEDDDLPADFFHHEEGAEFLVHSGAMSPNDFLEHYGVKGMRWGQRKAHGTSGAGETKKSMWDPEGHKLGGIKGDAAKALVLGSVPVIGLLAAPAQVRVVRGASRTIESKLEDRREKKDDKKFEQVAQSQKTFVTIHNGAVDRMNKDLVGLNKRYPATALKNPATMKKYETDVAKSMQAAYKESANKLGNKTGTKHLDVEFQGTGLDADFKIKVRDGMQTPTVEKEAKHAAVIDDEGVAFTGKLLRNEDGHILGLYFEDFDQPSQEELAQSTMERGADFLEHFGVKGMRWGVRKSDVGSAARRVGKAAAATGRFVSDVNFETKTTKGSDSNARLKREISGMAKEAFRRTDLAELKAKPEYADAKKLKNRLLSPRDAHTKAYRKEAKERYIKRLEEAANSKTNASNKRQYTIRERGWELPKEGGALPRSKYFWDVTTREVKHAADDPFAMMLELVMDEDGYITDIKEVSAEDSIAQSMELGADFLTGLGLEVGFEHYGVKGMRWGVRRDGGAPTAVDVTAASRVPHGDKRKTKIATAGGQNHDAAPDALKVASAVTKLKKSGVSTLSNQELREVQQRLILENQVKQLTQPGAQKFINRLLGNQGNQIANEVIREGVKPGVRRAGGAASVKVAEKIIRRGMG